MLVLTDDMPRWVQIEKAESKLPTINYRQTEKVKARIIPTDKQYRKYYEAGALKARECLFVFEMQKPFGKRMWVFTGIEDL